MQEDGLLSRQWSTQVFPAIPLLTSHSMASLPFCPSGNIRKPEGKKPNYLWLMNPVKKNQKKNQACWNISGAARLVQPLLFAFHCALLQRCCWLCRAVCVPAFCGLKLNFLILPEHIPVCKYTARILVRSQRRMPAVIRKQLCKTRQR